MFNKAKTEKSRELVRKEYLNNLLQENANERLNLQANKKFRKLGVVSAKLDNRTLEDKLNDNNEVMATLNRLLMTITDATQANKIIHSLSIEYQQFTITHWNVFEKLKSQFPYGMPAETFMVYLNKEIMEENKLNEEYKAKQRIEAHINLDEDIPDDEQHHFDPHNDSGDSHLSGGPHKSHAPESYAPESQFSQKQYDEFRGDGGEEENIRGEVGETMEQMIGYIEREARRNIDDGIKEAEGRSTYFDEYDEEGLEEEETKRHEEKLKSEYLDKLQRNRLTNKEKKIIRRGAELSMNDMLEQLEERERIEELQQLQELEQEQMVMLKAEEGIGPNLKNDEDVAVELLGEELASAGRQEEMKEGLEEDVFKGMKVKKEKHKKEVAIPKHREYLEKSMAKQYYDEERRIMNEYLNMAVEEQLRKKYAGESPLQLVKLKVKIPSPTGNSEYDLNTRMVVNRTNNERFFIKKALIKPDRGAVPKNNTILLYSPTGEIGTFRQASPDDIALYGKKKLKISPSEMDEFNNLIGYVPGETQNKEQYMIYTHFDDRRLKPIQLSNKMEVGEGESVWGIGIKKLGYKPFGNYIINADKLNNDILMVRYPSKQQIQKFKTRKIGKGLSHYIKKIIGGSIPHPNDYEGMVHEDDKMHFYPMIEAAGILGHLKIKKPVEQIDDASQKFHRFEVLHGEITAGNDNPKIIKELKILLLNLMKDGHIKEREGKDILLTLATLGH